MCENCGDLTHMLGAAGTSRRKLLLGGAGMVAAPSMVAAASGDAAAQTAPAPALTQTGPTKTRALAATGASSKFGPIEIERRAVGANDVLLDILYAAICHSDIHTVRGDWGPTNYQQNCLNGATFTYDSPDKVSGGRTYGGYSDAIVVTEKFVIRIPPGVDLAGFTPILCAGVTTFSPMQHWQLKPGQKVGSMSVRSASSKAA